MQFKLLLFKGQQYMKQFLNNVELKIYTNYPWLNKLLTKNLKLSSWMFQIFLQKLQVI